MKTTQKKRFSDYIHEHNALSSRCGMCTGEWESKHVPFSSTVRDSQKTKFHFNRSLAGVYNPECPMEAQAAESLIVYSRESGLYEEFKSHRKLSFSAEVW